MKIDRWQIPLLVLIGVLCVGAYCRYPANTSEAVAAWVQAVGSVGAILVAVWVAHRQYEQTRQLEQNSAAAHAASEAGETRAFVQAMRHEIQVIWEEYGDISATLRNTPANDFFSSVVPLSTDSLIVYSRTPERVGKIDDEALRALIVRTYTGLRGHLNSLRQNNDLIYDYERFFNLYKDENRQTLEQRKVSIMREYTVDLKNGNRELGKFCKSPGIEKRMDYRVSGRIQGAV